MCLYEELALMKFCRGYSGEAFGAIVWAALRTKRQRFGFHHLTMVMADRKIFMEGQNNSTVRHDASSDRDQFQPKVGVVMEVYDVRGDPNKERAKFPDHVIGTL